MLNQRHVYQNLLQIVTPAQVRIDEPLGQYTSARVGGAADVLVFPKTSKEVIASVRLANELNIPYFIMGSGSNTIVRDGGIRGIVIILTALTKMTVRGERIRAQGGASLATLSRMALQHRLMGMEFACGIPGTVGGAIRMNAGAYGRDIADVIESAIVCTHEGSILRLTNEQLQLRYRHSVISEVRGTVLEASVRLTRGSYEEIESRMKALTLRREAKQPLDFPSCGSVFRRPPNDYAGRLIQACGLQGFQIGGAQVSVKHAGFIVNLGNAMASDYIQLIHHVQTVVEERFGILLETEVEIVGE